MKKKLDLDNLEVTSFVTKLNPSDHKGGMEDKCGVTLCPPCTEDPRTCAESKQSMCMKCADITVIEPDERG